MGAPVSYPMGMKESKSAVNAVDLDGLLKRAVKPNQTYLRETQLPNDLVT